MMKYRGSMPSPKYKHGDEVTVAGTLAVVQSRNWTGSSWEYVCIPASGNAILYYTE